MDLEKVVCCNDAIKSDVVDFSTLVLRKDDVIGKERRGSESVLKNEVKCGLKSKLV